MREACSVVHVENVYASGREKRPRGPRPTVATRASNGRNEIPSASSLERPRMVDLKGQAVAYFMHYHLQPSGSALIKSRGIPDEVMALRKSKYNDPMLENAISSLALAVFSQKQQYPPAAVEASVNYHQLLQVMRKTLPYLDNSSIDTCLVTTFLMSRYEDAIARPAGRNRFNYHSFSHHDGTSAALKAWKFDLSHNGRATDVIKHSRRGTIRSALIRNLAVPDWLQDGSTFGEYGLELDYDRVSVRIVNLRQKLTSLFSLFEASGSPAAYQIFDCTVDELDEEARSIDEALQGLASQIPNTWSYQCHTLPDQHQPWPSKGFYSPTIYSYADPAHAAIWNLYFATRMLVSSTRLRVLKLNSQSTTNISTIAHEHQKSESYSNIRGAARHLASSLPYCLQRLNIDVDYATVTVKQMRDEEIKPYVANQIIWPLSIAASLAEVEPQLSRWFRAELASLGRVVCAGMLECAETDQWFEL